MKEAMKEFFEREYRETKRVLEAKPSWMGKPSDIVWYSTQRCLGVAQFIQTCPNGLSFEEVEAPYEEVRKKLENLLETY